MIISCGRKSVYASIYLKKQLRNKIINIHIQNPKINPKNFDYIISPNHDKLNGVNIINSTGALHHLTKNKIESASKIFDVPNNKKIVAIILGGENNHYHFNDKILNSFLDKIQNLNKVNEKYFFLFIPSRRTDNNLIKIIKNRFNLNHYVWDKVSENPYLYALKIADIFIVSSDSTSMISEASFTSKPLHIFHLPFKRKSERIERFHKEFEEKGITKPFKEELFYWSYEPLKESERIAGILSSRILKQKNE